MTQRNNTRIKVVFLIALVFSLISACTLPTAKNQDNRPSSQSEDSEERQPQATAASLPTHTSINRFLFSKTKTPPPSISDIPSSASIQISAAFLSGVFLCAVLQQPGVCFV
jgi:hypothetical protein